MIWFITFLLISFPFPQAKAAESNAGIVRGLWYDQELFFAGEPIRVYVAVRNNTGADLSGAVEFYVNGERIERNFIDALDGRIVESWADWTPQYGTSTISATLSRTEISSTASGTKSVTLTSSIADDIIFVDYDTDRDDIGNKEDGDDDGDGVSDEDERTASTDPLVYNQPRTTEKKDEQGKEPIDTKESSSENKSNKPKGLEQFLTDNRAGNTISSVTNFINNSKSKLDEYRESRIEDKTQTEGDETRGGEAAAPDTTSPENKEVIEITKETEQATTSHIGEITRSTENIGKNFGSFVKGVFAALKTAIIFIYDIALLGLSKFLAHPILVQISLLLLILFFVLKLAQRFSKRQY